MSSLQRLRVVHVLLLTSVLVGATALAFAAYTMSPRYGVFVALSVAAAALWWCRGVFSRRRVVLWIEERVPSLRWALASLVDSPDTPFRATLESRVRESRFTRPVTVAALRLVGIPILVLLGAQFLVAPLLARRADDVMRGRTRGDDLTPNTGRSRDLRFRATVTPPAYARQRQRTVDSPVAIAALVGSSVRVTGAFTTQATMPVEPTIWRLEGDAGTRMLALEPQPDSTPRVVLEQPERDTVIRVPIGTIRLFAQLRDDIGLDAGWFEIIVTSGSGETFTFRTAVLGRAPLNDSRDARLAATLSLDSLKLEAGDVVHMRAVARDRNPASTAEPGTSETRTLRVPRPSEGDTVGIEAMPPPEVNQSELSQRMLIILTERLVGRVRNISSATLGTESAKIAREQARLRKRVGEIIFTRLTGEEHVDDDAVAAMDDSLSPGEALLKAASEATDLQEEHAHEEGGPIIGVNRNLLQAFNAMWEAERRLGVSEPRQALPHMRAALDAIQRARAAERLYLRGRAPKIVLDIARIRLTGKQEGIDPGARSPRASALRATLQRRARFGAAIDLLAQAPSAAIDSLMLIRVDALGESPALAAALGTAIEQLREGRDATESIVAAHRALSGLPVTALQGRWSGSW